jgi:hypothetical protein
MATARPLPRWLWVGLHKWGLYSIWVAFAAALLLGMGLRWWVGVARFRSQREPALSV